MALTLRLNGQLQLGWEEQIKPDGTLSDGCRVLGIVCILTGHRVSEDDLPWPVILLGRRQTVVRASTWHLKYWNRGVMAWPWTGGPSAFFFMKCWWDAHPFTIQTGHPSHTGEFYPGSTIFHPTWTSGLRYAHGVGMSCWTWLLNCAMPFPGLVQPLKPKMRKPSFLHLLALHFGK